jgi:hypothetical protein
MTSGTAVATCETKTDTAGPGARQWPHAVSLAVLPWILLAFDRSWLYSPPGSIDPWLYHGFMRNYPAFVGGLFPGTYYGTRLGWILPGYVAYALLPPTAANFVLHLTFYYAAIAASYSILRRLSDADTALLGSLMIGSNPMLIVAFGWDYVDGALITYMLLSVAAATRATSAASPGRWLSASGAALAGMVHSNIATAFMVPLAPAAYVLLSPSRAKRAEYLLAVAAGFAIATAAMASVNVAAGGSWAFFLPSVRWALASGGPTHFHNPFLFPSVLRLLIPAVATVALLTAAASRQLTRDRAIAGAMFLWCVACFTAWDIAGNAFLATQYYVDWLVPLACIVLALIVGARTPATTPTSAWIYSVIFVIAGGLATRGTIPGVVPFGGEHTTISTPWWMVVFGSLLVLTIIAIQRSAKRVVTLIWAVLFAVAVSGSAEAMTFRPDRRSADMFEVVDKVLTIVKTNGPERRPLFWFGPSPLAPYFHSIVATHLYLYSTVGFQYPKLPDDILSATRFGTAIRPPARIVVLTTEPVDENQVRRAFASHRLAARVSATYTVATRYTTFLLTEIAVTTPVAHEAGD